MHNNGTTLPHHACILTHRRHSDPYPSFITTSESGILAIQICALPIEQQGRIKMEQIQLQQAKKKGFIIKHSASQDSQLTTLIVLFISFKSHFICLGLYKSPLFASNEYYTVKKVS